MSAESAFLGVARSYGVDRLGVTMVLPDRRVPGAGVSDLDWGLLVGLAKHRELVGGCGRGLDEEEVLSVLVERGGLL